MDIPPHYCTHIVVRGSCYVGFGREVFYDLSAGDISVKQYEDHTAERAGVFFPTNDRTGGLSRRVCGENTRAARRNHHYHLENNKKTQYTHISVFYIHEKRGGYYNE